MKKRHIFTKSLYKIKNKILITRIYFINSLYTNSLFQKGGVNISKKIHFTLIFALVLFLSINVISANEINENDVYSIDSSDSLAIDSVENTNYVSSDLSDNQNNDDSNTDNSQSNVLSDGETGTGDTTDDDSAVTETLDNTGTSTDTPVQPSKDQTSISVSSTSILRGTYLYVYLKDSSGKPISGKTISLKFASQTYTKTTDGNGAVSLKIGASVGKYAVKVSFIGDDDYLASSKDFTANVYRSNTKITIKSASVARGNYLYAYLKDSSGKPISGQTITLRLKGKTYKKTTDKNGRISHKIDLVASKYSTKLSFAGSTSYYSSSYSFTLKVYKQSTTISVASTSVIRGKYLYAYLKNSNGKALANRSIRIRFYYSKSYYKTFYKTTNDNGRVSLKINSKPASYLTKIYYKGSGYYKASSKSFYLKSYVASTYISVPNNTVVRGKYLYAYLKDSSNNAVANQKLVINFSGTKYERTTNSKGQVSLRIGAHPSSYSVKIKYSGSTGYKSSSKSLTVKVLNNVTHKLTVKSSSPGEFTVRLTDLNGNPISGQTVSITSYLGNQSTGSGVKMTKKTIIIDSDNIYNKATDLKFINDIAQILRSKGYRVLVNDDIGPNEHCKDIYKYGYEDVCVFCIFGGCDSGMFYDMSSKWYQNYLKQYNNRVVLGFTRTQVDLATCSWLKRAHDDNYSPSSFTGLSNPGSYLNEHGMDYVYGRTATEMANNFLNYAVKGLSIGLNNTIPCTINTYSVTTNENGYATVSGLSSGTYTMECSYSNTTLGYVADTIKTKVEIL